MSGEKVAVEGLQKRLESVKKCACCGEPENRVRAEFVAEGLRAELDTITGHGRGLHESFKDILRQKQRFSDKFEEIRAVFREEHVLELLLTDDEITATICETIRDNGRLKRSSADSEQLVKEFHDNSVVVTTDSGPMLMFLYKLPVAHQEETHEDCLDRVA